MTTGGSMGKMVSGTKTVGRSIGGQMKKHPMITAGAVAAPLGFHMLRNRRGRALDKTTGIPTGMRNY
jgi:hypothetical protein